MATVKVKFCAIHNDKERYSLSLGSNEQDEHILLTRWQQYKNAVHMVNNKLKKLCELLGLPVPLTSYVARHA